jgi:predicted SAM-dependent methyltransferase
MITRLQLGASRLENLDPTVLNFFLNKTWMHFGDRSQQEEYSGKYTLSVIEKFKKHSLSYIFNSVYNRVFKNEKKAGAMGMRAKDIYNHTNFKEFYYSKGNILPFENNSLDFIFSEHFFEHLFFDEALSLLGECYRILKPWGVIRNRVPDADLRTYEKPEPIGYPDIKLPFTDPQKHKTRWSVYSFSEVLRVTGFEPEPLRYCDKSGNYVCVNPADNKERYKSCPEQEMLFELRYIRRINSLIIDGIKTPSS